MPRLSVRDWTEPWNEISTMSERQMAHESATARVPAPWDTVTNARHIRWGVRSRNDDVLFEAAWFSDFRGRWRADLRNARLLFLAKLEAL
jgi:hypothetical protein